jgi:hypothetical protein
MATAAPARSAILQSPAVGPVAVRGVNLAPCNSSGSS